jgi:hypothetical protein
MCEKNVLEQITKEKSLKDLPKIQKNETDQI